LEKVPNPTIYRTQSQSPQDKMQNGFMFCVLFKGQRQLSMNKLISQLSPQNPSQLDNSLSIG
jgi:hypothetical protein